MPVPIVKHRKPARKATPVEKTIEIHSLSHEAHGVGRSEDKVVFVPGALPSETVKVRIEKAGRNFDQAQLLEIQTASDERVEPQCPHFEKCGACQLQFLQSDKQLPYKKEDLHQQLTRKLKLDDLPWQPLIESEPYGYRRRARLGVRYRNKLDEIIIGFREESNSHLTAIQECLVMHPRLSQLISPLHEVISKLNGKSVITQIELLMDDHGPSIILRHLKPLKSEDTEQLLHWSKHHDASVWLEGDDSLVALHKTHEGPLQYKVDDCEIHFGVKDFIQGNQQVNQSMVATALDWLNLKESETVLDLFAGSGNFTIPISKRGKTSLRGRRGEGHGAAHC